ncbi:hypothetical protein [Lysobacter panacisoli]|uniref:Uncharacterized protein n=1 Tax=Lysobacter panacisoli TaxID=1255263 RepID=A0ABP9LK84_9GAMM|nr:hypothetical protein [Lysobacter panacisoli]
MKIRKLVLPIAIASALVAPSAFAQDTQADAKSKQESAQAQQQSRQAAQKSTAQDDKAKAEASKKDKAKHHPERELEEEDER